MATRRPNHRLVKIHWNYTVEEVARLLGKHRSTIRHWINHLGLPAIADKKPMLILGRELISFLQRQRSKNKRPCQPGEVYCVRCRVPRRPAGEMVEYQPLTVTLGKLTAICPTCGTLMHQRINLTKLQQMSEIWGITVPQAARHIPGSRSPCVNSDFP